MNISCLQENLQKGLQLVSHVSGKEHHLPILSTILLKAHEGLITLYATNLELGASCTIRGKVEKEGSVAVPAKIFSDYISLLPKEKINIEIHEDYTLHITCHTYSTKILGMNPDEFPLLPPIESPSIIECQTTILKKALQQTLFTVSVNESKQELSGVLFSLNAESKKLTIVGTDAYRLAEYSLIVEESPREDHMFIMPLRTAQELSRILSVDVSGKALIEWNDHQISFSCDIYHLISKRIQGTYPDYTQIIPQSFATKVVLDVEQCIKAVKATSLFSKSTLSDIHIQCVTTNRDKGRLLLSSSNATSGESSVQLECDMQGSENEATLNFRYFLDGLQAIENKRAILSLIDNANPCILKPFEGEGYQYLIMPIRQ